MALPPSFWRAALVVAGVGALLGGAVLLGGGKKSNAAPYVPANDAVVLEHLPAGASDPRTRELAALRRQLDADPKNLELATELARKNIEESRARADPRYLGHAEAALGPWWSEPSPPPEVLLLRATIKQSVHEFDAALKDLELLLQERPSDAQAWLTRSVILSVRGDYAEAKRSCGPLAKLAAPLVTASCLASVDSLSGEAKPAYARLRDALERAPAASPAERAWILSSLGEIAVRAGDDAAGERHYKEALASDPSDGYTRAAYADLLLDEARPAEAIPLLRDRENDDNLLLRLAIAEEAAHLPTAAAHIETLAARYQASEARGDVVHRREQARFHLALRRDARTSLELARANWDVQKEPWDARIFMESALAAGNPRAAHAVAEFLARSGAEEPRLVALAARIR